MVDRKELPRTVFVSVYFQKTQFKSSINMREILRPFRVLENLTKLAPKKQYTQPFKADYDCTADGIKKSSTDSSRPVHIG